MLTQIQIQIHGIQHPLVATNWLFLSDHSVLQNFISKFPSHFNNNISLSLPTHMSVIVLHNARSPTSRHCLFWMNMTVSASAFNFTLDPLLLHALQVHVRSFSIQIPYCCAPCNPCYFAICKKSSLICKEHMELQNISSHVS